MSGTLLDTSACSAFPYSKTSQTCLQASGDLPITLHQLLEFSEHRDVLQTSRNTKLHLQQIGKADSVSSWCWIFMKLRKIPLLEKGKCFSSREPSLNMSLSWWGMFDLFSLFCLGVMMRFVLFTHPLSHFCTCCSLSVDVLIKLFWSTTYPKVLQKTLLNLREQ